MTSPGKGELRQLMKERCRKASVDNPDAPHQLRDLFLRSVQFPSPSVIGGYAPVAHEMDAGPLLNALMRYGYTMSLPCVVGEGQPLVFRRYQPGDALTKNRYGIGESPATREILEPDILLVPFRAFDRELYRLGYGGGYYDRTLKLLRSKRKTIAIGLGYAIQQWPELPRESHDEPLDKVITEIQVFSR